jgi:hypothetical protein
MAMNRPYDEREDLASSWVEQSDDLAALLAATTPKADRRSFAGANAEKTEADGLLARGARVSACFRRSTRRRRCF